MSAVQKPINPVSVFVLTLTLSGCLSTGIAPQSVAPESVAPVTPANVTAPTSAQLLEPLKGGLIGGSFGNGLTPVEKQRGLVAEYRALETSFGQAPVIWLDDKTKNSGEVVAGAPYRVGQQDCRPYSHKLTRKVATTMAVGSACRQENGAWLRLE
jgi:surface antigen